jgi:hypothetical protein
MPHYTVLNDNVLCVAAIQALVSLNEQISTSLALSESDNRKDCPHPSPPQLHDGGSVASRQQQALDSSMALMRRLLVDAQVINSLDKFLYFTRISHKTTRFSKLKFYNMTT